VIKFGMRSPKIRRYAVIIAMALMLASVVVLADVIYYYQGVITAQVTTPPLVFYSGKSFTYSPCPPPPPPPPKSPPTCTYNLNSLVPGYANFTASPKGTGFTATIQLTNASYAYFYHALGLVVKTPGWLYVTNVMTSGNEIINTLTIIVQSASTGQRVCSFTVISNAQPITSPTTACPLSTGPYFISVLVQPNTPLSPSQSETVTLYFGYNVVNSTTVPLPPT
jgi:hypothetical protein